METARKSKKRGVTFIEITMGIAIIGILLSYTLIRYSSVKEMNDLKMLETRVITTINNANIALSTSRSIQPRYMKFYEGGIVIAKGYNSNIYEIEYDTGMNRKKLESKSMSMILNCGEENGIPCPILLYEDDGTIVKSDRTADVDNPAYGKTGYPLTKGIPQLDNPTAIPGSNNNKGIDNYLALTDTQKSWYKDNRNTFRYIKFENGNTEKTFYVLVFDRKGILKTRIEFLKDKSVMTITPTISKGTPIKLSEVEDKIDEIKNANNWQPR